MCGQLPRLAAPRHVRIAGAVVTFRSQPAGLVVVSAVEQLVLELALGPQDWQQLSRSVMHGVRARLCAILISLCVRSIVLIVRSISSLLLAPHRP